LPRQAFAVVSRDNREEKPYSHMGGVGERQFFRREKQFRNQKKPFFLFESTKRRINGEKRGKKGRRERGVQDEKSAI